MNLNRTSYNLEAKAKDHRNSFYFIIFIELITRREKNRSNKTLFGGTGEGINLWDRN